ncbi:hypothetical protein ACEPAI_4758 [Sanghuangporus weigelae]
MTRKLNKNKNMSNSTVGDETLDKLRYVLNGRAIIVEVAWTCVPEAREPKTSSHTERHTNHKLLLHDFDSFDDSGAAERLLEGVKDPPCREI